MRSEGNTGAHVGGGDVEVSTTPVVYEGRDELGDRHFHDVDATGSCRNEGCSYRIAPLADNECTDCKEIVAKLIKGRCRTCHVEAQAEAERRSFESSHKEEPAEDVVELPDYIMAIALVMRDTEGHPDRAVRAARKVVVAALQGLDRVLRASTSPSRVDATPPDHVVDETPRGRRLDGTPRKRRPNLTDTEKAELKRRYEAGESTTELGRAFGMSATGVGNALRKLGTAMRDRGGRSVA